MFLKIFAKLLLYRCIRWTVIQLIGYRSTGNRNYGGLSMLLLDFVRICVCDLLFFLFVNRYLMLDIRVWNYWNFGECMQFEEARSWLDAQNWYCGERGSIGGDNSFFDLHSSIMLITLDDKIGKRLGFTWNYCMFVLCSTWRKIKGYSTRLC